MEAFTWEEVEKLKSIAKGRPIVMNIRGIREGMVCELPIEYGLICNLKGAHGFDGAFIKVVTPNAEAHAPHEGDSYEQ